MFARFWIMLHTDTRPMVDRVAKPEIAAIPHQHHASFAALAGDRSDPRVCPQGMVVSIGQQLRCLGDHRRGDDTAHSGKREQHGDVWQSLFLLRGAEFFQCVVDAASYRKTLLMEKSKMRQEQENVFAGRLNGARR
jgi:hypothetical protein